MSDYLTRIVERAGSAPAAVRPALPSRFEPVRADGTFTPAAAVPGTEPTLGTEPNLPPTEKAVSGSRAIHERMASIESLWTTASPTNKPHQVEPASNQRSAGAPRTPVAEPAERVLAGESPAVVASPTDAPKEVDPMVQLPVVRRDESVQLRHAAERKESSAPPPQNGNPMPNTTRMDWDQRTANPTQPVLLSANLPSASRERTRPDTAPVPPANSAPTPIIHVTIGRVEVRAITPPAAAPAQRSERAIPKLSLDDYLRSRKGGGA